MAGLLAVYFGLRASECVGLRLGQIQWGRDVELYVRGKGHKPRVVLELHVPAVMKGILRRAWERRWETTGHDLLAYLLVDDDGQPLLKRRLCRTLQAAAKAEGVVGPCYALPLDFHRLRHLCACRLLAAGESPKNVAEYLGHASPLTTIESYLHNQTDLDPIDAMLAALSGPAADWVPLSWLAAVHGLTLPGLRAQLLKWTASRPRELVTTHTLGLKRGGRPKLCLRLSDAIQFEHWLMTVPRRQRSQAVDLAV